MFTPETSNFGPEIRVVFDMPSVSLEWVDVDVQI